MKKSFIKKVIFISIFSLLLSGCFFKDKADAREEMENKFNNFIYEYTIAALKNNNDSKIYLPECEINFLNRTLLKDGNFLLVVDHIFPNNNLTFDRVEFYDIYSDSGDWVDELIMNLEEERIAAQILEMENMLDNISNPVNEEENAAQNKENIQNATLKEVRNADRALSHMEYGEEIFIPQTFENNAILIHGYKENITRSFYDNLYRCYKEEKWLITSDKEELVSTVETKYQNDSYVPLEKKYSTKETVKVQTFNNNGLVIKEDNYSIIENKQYIKTSLSLKYNNDNKVRENSLTEYTYKDENCSKLLYSFNKKYIYRYNDDDIPPNFDYYENNILKIRNRYSSAEKYTSKIYFDGGLSVLTYYENNKPVKEIFTSADGVERVKNHEN